MRILFLGTSSFAVSIFSMLVEAGYRPIALITKPDARQGRSGKLIASPVRQWYLDTPALNNIPCYQPEQASSPQFLSTVASLQPELSLIVAFGEILSPAFIELSGKLCLNVHASLLPKYRGAAPIAHVLLNGEKESGVSIINISEKVDAGAILHRESCSISPDQTAGQLEERLAQMGGEALLHLFPKIQEGNYTTLAQEEEKATLAPKLLPEDRQISWNRSVREIHNQIRALSPKPGAWSRAFFGEEEVRVKLFRSSILSQTEEKGVDYGKVIGSSSRGIEISCKRGRLLLLSLQFPGKKKMDAAQWICGCRGKFLSFL